MSHWVMSVCRFVVGGGSWDISLPSACLAYSNYDHAKIYDANLGLRLARRVP